MKVGNKKQWKRASDFNLIVSQVFQELEWFQLVKW